MGIVKPGLIGGVLLSTGVTLGAAGGVLVLTGFGEFALAVFYGNPLAGIGLLAGFVGVAMIGAGWAFTTVDR